MVGVRARSSGSDSESDFDQLVLHSDSQQISAEKFLHSGGFLNLPNCFYRQVSYHSSFNF